MSRDNKEDTVVIDEALARTGFGKFNILLMIYTGFVINTVYLEAVGVSFALPVLECDLNLSHRQQGILGAVSFVGVIASSHFWGFLADTQGRKRTMQPALILGFVITAFSSLSPNFLTFALLRFLNGILLSACSATIFAYVGEFHCQKDRSRAILGGSVISAAVSIFLPVIAWIFINQEFEVYVPYINIVFKPWRSYFLACGVPGFICGLILFFLPESPKYLLSAGKPEEAIEVLKRIHRINLGSKDPDSAYTVTTLLPDADTPMGKVKGLEKKNLFASILQSMWQQTAPLFMREHLRKTVLSSLILYIIFFSAHGVYMWFPYILNTITQYTEKFTEPKRICEIIKFVQSGNLTSMDKDSAIETCSMHLEISTYVHTIFLEAIYVIMLLIITLFISRVGRKLMLFINLLICGACGILAFTIQIPLLGIYLLVIQLCCGCGISVLNAIVVEIFPTNLSLSACSATTFTYLGEFHCQKDRSRAIIGGSFISAAVAILIPIMAGIFINQDFEVYVPYIDIVFKPWRSYFLAFGVPGLICGLIMFFLPESPKYLLSAGKPEEAIEVLKLMHRINIGSKDPDSVYTVTTLLPDADTPMAKVKGLEKKNIVVSIMQSMWQQTALLFMREHLRKTVLSSLILYIIFFSAHGVYMWFPYILNNTMQYTEKFTEPKRMCDIIKFVQSGNLTSVDEDNSTETCKMHLEISTYVHSFFLEIIYVSILMIIMFFISRIGRKPMLFINLLICGVCGILAFTIKIPLLAVYLLVIQLCCGCVISVVNAIVVEIFPTHLRGMAVCISLMSGRIGSVMGSNILGLLIETHCEIALFSPAVALIIAGALGFLLPSANHQVAKAKDLENNS